MELDTGVAISVMMEKTYKTVWNAENAPPIQPTNMKLHMYTGDSIPALEVVSRNWFMQLTLNIDLNAVHHAKVLCSAWAG